MKAVLLVIAFALVCTAFAAREPVISAEAEAAGRSICRSVMHLVVDALTNQTSANYVCKHIDDSEEACHEYLTSAGVALNKAAPFISVALELLSVSLQVAATYVKVVVAILAMFEDVIKGT